MKWTVRVKVDAVVEFDDDAVDVPYIPSAKTAPGDALSCLVQGMQFSRPPASIAPGGRVSLGLTRESAALARRAGRSA